jgi:hypothetical protein
MRIQCDSDDFIEMCTFVKLATLLTVSLAHNFFLRAKVMISTPRI